MRHCGGRRYYLHSNIQEQEMQDNGGLVFGLGYSLCGTQKYARVHKSPSMLNNFSHLHSEYSCPFADQDFSAGLLFIFSPLVSGFEHHSLCPPVSLSIPFSVSSPLLSLLLSTSPLSRISSLLLSIHKPPLSFPDSP